MVSSKSAATGEPRPPLPSTKLIRANKEVILCAGAIQSPQLLMLSGIGPADHLKEHEIPVIHDNPNVGSNFIDHPATSIILKLKSPYEGGDQYYGNGIAATAFYQSSWSKKNTPNNGADMQLAPAGGKLISGFGPSSIWMQIIPGGPPPRSSLKGRILRNLIHLTRGMIQKVLKDPLSKAMNNGIVCNQPKSRGTLKLQSNNPYEHPLIDPHCLENEADLERLVEALKKLRTVFKSSPMAERIEEEVKPGPNVKTDAEIAEYIRTTIFAAWHPVGTCKMSKGNDAVVDSHLRVVGVKNLRVADASIMPYIVSGNTNMASIVIGGKGAELILEDLKDKKD